MRSRCRCKALLGCPYAARITEHVALFVIRATDSPRRDILTHPCPESIYPMFKAQKQDVSAIRQTLSFFSFDAASLIAIQLLSKYQFF